MISVCKIVKKIIGRLRGILKDRPDVANKEQPSEYDHQTPLDVTTDFHRLKSAIAASSNSKNSMEDFQKNVSDVHNIANEGQPPGYYDYQPPPDTTTYSSQPTSTVASSFDPPKPTNEWKGFIAKQQERSYVPNVVTKQQPQPHLPKSPLSGCEESSLDVISPVLKQQSYTDRQPVIKSSITLTSCSELGVNGLLDRLNDTLGTPYTLKTLSESLRSALESCVDRDYDFGTAYARLRPYWFEDTSRDIVEDECKDQDIRNQLLVDNKIIDGDAPPRRVWDLYANRVVPYWVVGKYPWAISHAWVNDDELTRVMTPINQNQWPVPIPKDASFDLIRIEMLSLGAEYVWLDVLCMTQE
ncbi:hypothetical protein ARMGADRAFT_991978, partial [Armillaria gallica]